MFHLPSGSTHPGVNVIGSHGTTFCIGDILFRLGRILLSNNTQMLKTPSSCTVRDSILINGFLISLA